MFEVTLHAVAANAVERVERVVHKHSGGKLDHLARVALLAKVAAGQPQVIARYHEELCAANVITELTLLRATASVGKTVEVA